MDQHIVAATRVLAVLTCVGLVATVPVGGGAMFGRALLVVAVGLVLLLVTGCVLVMAVRPAAEAGGTTFGAITRPLTLPMRSVVRERTVDVSSFSIKEVSGATVNCDVRGAVRAAAPSRGDMVEVYGKRLRTGAVLVHQFVDRTSGTTLPVRMPVACVTARLASVAVAALWALATLGMAVLLVFG
ncbi:hypothetical protein [Actinocrispum wychmicini]|uniref:hypothetical protein n=1 Tax=Actinocrispum wychmicini TaxID=1213861 RepID=UPI0010463D91|nr:hypothetical protein [Actinocrispum wychmicini]